jgi:hypothetical protein
MSTPMAGLRGTAPYLFFSIKNRCYLHASSTRHVPAFLGHPSAPRPSLVALNPQLSDSIEYPTSAQARLRYP